MVRMGSSGSGGGVRIWAVRRTGQNKFRGEKGKVVKKKERGLAGVSDVVSLQTTGKEVWGRGTKEEGGEFPRGRKRWQGSHRARMANSWPPGFRGKRDKKGMWLEKGGVWGWGQHLKEHLVPLKGSKSCRGGLKKFKEPASYLGGGGSENEKRG